MSKSKKYNLAIPVELFDQLQALADERQTTIADLLRRFVKLGLMVAAESDPGTKFLVRRGGVDSEIILL